MYMLYYVNMYVCVCAYIDKYSSVYGGGGQTYAYHHEEDESSFRLVDTARVQKPPHHTKRIKYSQVTTLVFTTMLLLLK